MLNSDQEKSDSVALGSDPTGQEDDRPVILCFALRGMWFGLDARMVKEVVGTQKITIIPGASAHILGVISLHGRAVAMLDLHRFFELPQTDDERQQDLEGRTARTLVLQVDGVTVGVVADKVDRIVELDAGRLRSSQVHHEGRLAGYVTGEFDLDERVVTVVDPIIFTREARV